MNAQLRAACAAVTLVGVWPSAEAQNTVAVVNESDLTYATGLYQYNASGGGPGLLVSPAPYGDLAETTGDSPYVFEVDERGSPTPSTRTFPTPSRASTTWRAAGSPSP